MARAELGRESTSSTRVRPHRRQGIGAVVVALALLVSGLVTIAGAPPAAAAGDPQVPVSLIALDQPTYDRYEPIIIDAGAIGFFPSCPNGGVRDFIYPWADVYIVRGDSVAVGGLSDVNGAPNTVGGSGGGVFGEVIGYAGVNNLSPGTYSIVVDECQDGRRDFNDTVFPAAFRVTARTSVNPMTGIGSLKAGAQVRAEAARRQGREWQALLLINEVLGYASAFVANPPGVAIGIGVASFLATKLQGLATGAFPDPKAIIATHYTNKARHWEGIAKDPPDPNYQQPTTLAGSEVPASVYEGPPFDAAGAALDSSIAEADLTEALLHSIERYQGAAAVGDGTYALLHARQAQDFARLLANQLRLEGPDLEAAASAIEADPRPFETVAGDLDAAIDDVFANGLSDEQEAQLARSGVTRSELAVELSRLAALDLGSFDRSAMAADLRADAAQGAAFADVLDAFADGTQARIDELLADPWAPELLPVADAGGPYAATVGGSVAVDASASTPGADGAALATYEWDLDGDGAFDDATGVTASGDPGPARDGLVGVRVTDADGETSTAFAPISVTGGPGPAATTSEPADDGAQVELGDTLPMAFAVPGATTQWLVDGVAVHTGATFAYSPASAAELGAHRIRAEAPTGAGTGAARDWTVTVVGPDADGDGYSPAALDPALADCDDTNPDVHPGAPELLDGIDNDCNPASPDGGVAPVAEAGGAVAAPEGTPAPLVGASLSASGATGPFTATVDWGDGTSEPASVSGANVTADHAYADDGSYPVEVCVSSATGLVSCDQTTATISNEAATPLFVSLRNWSDEFYTPWGQGNPNWTVAPDGQSAFQSVNAKPSLFISDQPLIGTEAQVTIGVETGGDDDFVGFAVGAEPGDTADPDAAYLLIDWKQRNQSLGCGLAPAGLAVSYVSGIPHPNELWGHGDCEPGPGSVTELARAATLGSTGWADNDTNLFRFAYTTTSLQIWVDGVLEFDIDLDTLLPDGTTTVRDVVGPSFPVGNLAFYNFSQQAVRYSGYQLSALAALEGTPRTVVADFRDPGTADTHIGRFDFGDGAPEENAVIAEVDGAGTATAVHTYAQEGDYPSELCLTDDDGAVGCQAILVRVANLPPVVDAGPDQVGGPAITLDKVTFTDPGVLDTHTATIDWGDGSPVEAVDPADVASELGSGSVTGTHTFAPGTYDVEVCVTDDAGDTGCDTLQVAILGPTPPAPETLTELTVLEGDDVEGGVAYVDLNTSDTATVTVDWDDGTVEPAAVQSRNGQGSGLLIHVYQDDGVYLPLFTVCDDTGRCESARMTVTVGNVAPTVTATVDSPAPAGTEVALAAPFTDPGGDDTHTATVDWGDGSGRQPLALALRVAAGSHRYDAAGDYSVQVCVRDDDGGEGCTDVPVSVTAADPDPTTPDPTTPDPTTPDPTTPDPTTPDPTTPDPTTPAPSTTSDPGSAAPAPVAQAPAPVSTTVATGTLPQTGAGGTSSRVGVGIGLVLLGGLLLLASRRRRTALLRSR